MQQSCPDAFTDELGIAADVRIAHFFETLVGKFSSTQMEYVADLSTRLVLSVFGVDGVSDLDLQQDFINTYLKRARCAEYVMKRMQVLQTAFRDSYTFEAAATGVQSLVPGTSLYLIYNRIPVYVSFSWMWKCAILHGAGDKWLQDLSNGVTCETSPKTENTYTAQTIRDRMLYDDAMYTRKDMQTVYADQVLKDLDYLVYLAIYQVGAGQCTDEIVSAVRRTLLRTDQNTEWYRWTVDHMVKEGILEKRDEATTTVSKYTSDFPYLRFKALNYDKLERALLYDPVDSGTVCSNIDLQLTTVDMCHFLYALEGCVFHNTFFIETLQTRSEFVQAVNFVLLFVERNMHILPSFAGSEFNILYDERLTQTFREVSVGSMNSVAFTKAFQSAQEYDKFMENKGFECGSSDIDLQSATSVLHLRLKSCVDAMQQDGGWEVPALQKIRIHMSPAMLTQGFYLTFTETRTGDRWLSQLFAMEISDLNSASDAICYMADNDPVVMNPYWAGDFDFETGCDTSTFMNTRYFDVRCRQRSSVNSSDMNCPAKHKSYVSAVRSKMLAACEDHDRARDTLLRLNMGSLIADQVPLCDRKPPVESTCDRVHGTMHNFQGTDVLTFDRTDQVDLQEGVWNPKNVITRGIQTDATSLLALKVRTTDIAGHSLLFKVSEGSGMRLQCLNLANLHETTCERSVLGWLAQVEGEWQRQHRFMLARWPITQRRKTNWHCPVQWLTAYSGLSRSFAAATPSRERNMIRFSHLTGDFFYAHPTVASVAPVANLRAARFMSDFQSCGLLDDAACHGRGFLVQTVARLRATNTWHEVLHETSPCQRILDWPHETFTLRDRQAPNSSATAPCIVYDRLPRFALAIQRGAVTRAPSLSSAPGGVCHMGRLLRLSDPDQTKIQRCARRDGVVRCLGVRDDVRKVVDFTPSPPYTPVKTDLPPRRRCATCSAGGSRHFVHTSGPRQAIHPPRAMLSTGEQARLSPERVLAAELRRRVCGAAVDCPLLTQVFDSSQWRTERFMKALLDGRTLVQAERAWTTPPPASGVTETPAPDDVLWARPWVFCTTVDGSPRCSGSIPRTTWVNPASRPSACAHNIKSSDLHSPNTRIVFCLLNSETEELCSKIVGWRDKVQNILCQAAGVCPAADFFYSPTAYDLSNQEFAHDTVRKYYEGMGHECPAPQILAQDQIDSNTALLDRCAANAMERVRKILYGLRTIKELLVRIMYYYANICTYVLNLFVAAVTVQVDLLQQSAELLIRYVLMFLDAISQVMKELFAALAQVIFGGGRMSVILDIIIILCEVVQWIINNIIKNVMCFIIKVISSILNLVGDILVKIGAVVPPAKDVGKTLVKLANDMKGMTFCTMQMNMGCRNLLPDETAARKGTLRTPTRCWASYVTFFGDTEQLSCTTADTCKTSLADTTLVICGACPAPARTHRDFGCSAVTKQCTCNVPTLSQTSCTSNAACDPETTSATCQYVDEELQPSTGFIECATCPQRPFCLVSNGASSGVCSCGVFDSPFAACSRQDYGSAVSPPFARPCLYTMDPKFSRARDFKISFAKALAAPCQDLSKAYCMNVVDIDTFWIVGLYASGRRLLEHRTTATSRAAVCLDAAAFGMQNTERACAQACVRSRETVADLGLTTEIESCAFASVEDFGYALHTNPLLLATLASRPDTWLVMLVRHSPLHSFVNSTSRAARVLHRLASIDDLATTLVFNRSEDGAIRVTTTNPRLVPVAAANAIQLVCALAELLSKSPMVSPVVAQVTRGPSRRLLFAEVGAAVQNALIELDSLRDSYANQVADIFSYRYADVDTSATRSAWLYDLGPDTAAAFRASPCKVLSDTLALFRNCFDGLEKSYTAKELQATPAASLADAWAIVTPKPVDSTAKSQSNFVVAGIVAACQALGISPATIYAGMQAVVNELRFSVKCDYIAVQTCSSWRMHIIHGTVIVGVWFAAWFIFCGVLNLSFIATLTLPFFGIVVMIVTYGYSFQCAPMVPVCLFEDMHAALRTIFPRQMALPRVLLLDSAFCQALAESPPAQCIRSCSDPPWCMPHGTPRQRGSWQSSTSETLRGWHGCLRSTATRSRLNSAFAQLSWPTWTRTSLQPTACVLCHPHTCSCRTCSLPSSWFCSSAPSFARLPRS